MKERGLSKDEAFMVETAQSAEIVSQHKQKKDKHKAAFGEILLSVQHAARIPHTVEVAAVEFAAPQSVRRRPQVLCDILSCAGKGLSSSCLTVFFCDAWRFSAGWNVFNQDALFKGYKKRLDKLPKAKAGAEASRMVRLANVAAAQLLPISNGQISGR